MRRAGVALAAALTACASAPRLRAPVDPTALRAGDGRVAVRVEATGAAQGVTVVPTGTRVAQGRGPDPWCTTPCTLHLAPGEHALWTGSGMALDAVTRVQVGPRPVEVHLRTASRPQWERGRNLLVGGVGLAVVGGIFVAFSPLEVAGGSPTGPETIAVGVGVAAIGAALIVLGVRGMRAQRAGADAVRELAEAAR